MRVERKKLEYEGDIAVAGFKALHRLAIDQDFAPVDLLKPGNGAQRGCLAAAGRPEQHDELAMPDRRD